MNTQDNPQATHDIFIKNLEIQAKIYIENGQLEAADQCIQQLNSLRPDNSELMLMLQEARKTQKARKKKITLYTVLAILLFLLCVGCGIGSYYYKNVYGEQAQYEQLMDTTDMDALQSYLDDYPNGKHAEEVRERLKDLQANVDDWQKASDANTVEAYQDFINKHPESGYADMAKGQIEGLLWDAVLSKGDEYACGRYIEMCPDGKHIEEVYKRMNIQNMQNLTDEETNQVCAIISEFISGMESGDETRLLSNVTPILTRFNNKKDATKVDVINYMKKFHGADINSVTMNITQTKVNKRVQDADNYFYDVNSDFDIHFTREDPNGTTFASVKLKATVNSDMKITSAIFSGVSKN